MPFINYAQFGERLHEQALARRIPTNGSFELTFRCNLRCVHCYCNLPLNDLEAIEKELKTEQVFDILDQIAEAGCLWLLITGGEPFLRKDFLDIYTYAKKKGFLINIFTNGTLLTPEIADYLAEWPPFDVEITLYGITEETYEKVTGIPGSFSRCKRGIDLLLERGIPLSLKTMALTLNYPEIPKIKKFSERLGVKFRFDPEINPRLDRDKTPCSFRLSPEEVVNLDQADEKRIKAWREFWEEFADPPRSDNLYVCGAGISTFHIDPYGQLSVCMMSRSQSYDLLKGNFQQGWSDFIPQVLAQKPKSDYECGQCEFIAICSQCPGWAWLENGDLETPVEYLCQTTHLRAEAFNKEKSLIREEV
jgi:radical SAM protein with 4Fe4S-binding SPASM domain